MGLFGSERGQYSVFIASRFGVKLTVRLFYVQKVLLIFNESTNSKNKTWLFLEFVPLLKNNFG